MWKQTTIEMAARVKISLVVTTVFLSQTERIMKIAGMLVIISSASSESKKDTFNLSSKIRIENQTGRSVVWAASLGSIVNTQHTIQLSPHGRSDFSIFNPWSEVIRTNFLSGFLDQAPKFAIPLIWESCWPIASFLHSWSFTVTKRSGWGKKQVRHLHAVPFFKAKGSFEWEWFQEHWIS